MATPHHRTFPTEEQRRRHPQRSLLHRTRLQRPPAPDSSTNLHATACAVMCGGHQERACPQPLCSWRHANPLDHSPATRHAHGALLRSGCVLPEHTLPTACPPSCMAHAVAHTSPEIRAPRLSLHRAAAHAHAPSRVRPRRGTRAARAFWTRRTPAAIQCRAHCAALPSHPSVAWPMLTATPSRRS
jgi:hypothetical protein